MLRDSRSVLILSAVLLFAALVAPGAVAATDGSVTTGATDEDAESFVVDLAPDGDATVTLTLRYDLADDSDGAAFEALRERPGNVTTQFDDRLSRIAERTAAETGREMTVSDARIDVESSDGVGVVRISAQWHGLAADDNGTLTVTEPFASGFSIDRPLTVSAPDGYEVTATTPPTAERNGSTATWDAGAALDGFNFTAEEAESESGDADSTGGSVPGFGIAVAVLAFLVSTVIAKRR